MVDAPMIPAPNLNVAGWRVAPPIERGDMLTPGRATDARHCQTLDVDLRKRSDLADYSGKTLLSLWASGTARVRRVVPLWFRSRANSRYHRSAITSRTPSKLSAAVENGWLVRRSGAPGSITSDQAQRFLWALGWGGSELFEGGEEEFVHAGAEFGEGRGVGVAGRAEDAVESVG